MHAETEQFLFLFLNEHFRHRLARSRHLVQLGVATLYPSKPEGEDPIAPRFHHLEDRRLCRA